MRLRHGCVPLIPSTCASWNTPNVRYPRAGCCTRSPRCRNGEQLVEVALGVGLVESSHSAASVIGPGLAVGDEAAIPGRMSTPIAAVVMSAAAPARGRAGVPAPAVRRFTLL